MTGIKLDGDTVSMIYRCELCELESKHQICPCKTNSAALEKAQKVQKTHKAQKVQKTHKAQKTHKVQKTHRDENGNACRYTEVSLSSPMRFTVNIKGKLEMKTVNII